MPITQGLLTVKAHRGDCKTLLAFSLPKKRAAGLAGFTIICQPEGLAPYYLYNTLQFEHPGQHAQVADEPAYSSVNAPLHKFRWLHVPGSFHGAPTPVFGVYLYTVVPRYFDEQGRLKAIDSTLGASVEVEVGPFVKGGLKLGFTRGYTQSQAFVHHFGDKAKIQPAGRALLFDTAQQAGVSPEGQPYSYADAYEWMGFTARQRIFEFLDEVIADPQQYLSVFAYDLNEPDVCKRLLRLAGEGRVRVVLDNAGLHHSVSKPEMEDRFEAEFRAVCKGPADILRGRFGSFAHDKVFISFNPQQALKVLTGSTNFSTTGLYVNSNHVLVFDDSEVAQTYGDMFEAVWATKADKGDYLATPFATLDYTAPAGVLPPTGITFAPHAPAVAAGILDQIVQRVAQEGKRTDGHASVMFAIMDVGVGSSPVYDALTVLHASQDVVSFGVSDNQRHIALYEPGRATGLLVTGKPGATLLPPPFDQIRNVVGLGHQIHHKFVVCGFNTADAVVYCGSSNLVTSGEQNNGDNLLTIRDSEVATVFAIEALGLVDHFQFMDRMSRKAATPEPLNKLPASKQQAAAKAHWYLSTSDAWAAPYFVADDLHARDRVLFAGVPA
jgi:phosphatidylserine/phosphatidylglycerophosphate/cardiolipin synthase-like enzyme